MIALGDRREAHTWLQRGYALIADLKYSHLGKIADHLAAQL